MIDLRDPYAICQSHRGYFWRGFRSGLIVGGLCGSLIFISVAIVMSLLGHL